MLKKRNEAINAMNMNNTAMQAADEELNMQELENASGGVLGLIIVGWTALNVAVYGTAFALNRNSKR